jgi:hypothetical protein
MAASWITGAISSYINPIVNSAVSSAGELAGSVASGIGNGINGVGRSIEGSIRGYGDAAKDYGNSIKDWTKADGVRQGTAVNPLGLSDTSGAGKRALANPRVNAPRKPEVKKEVKALPAPQQAKKPTTPAARALPSAKPSTTTKAPVRAPTKPGPSTTPSTGKKRISLESMPEHRRAKLTGPQRRKTTNTAARATGVPAKKWEPSKEAKNPLGL